jgi:hypothetical protein
MGTKQLNSQQQTKPKSARGSLDKNGQAFLDIIDKGLCSTCTVLSGGTRTVFEDGSHAGPAQGVYIHHVISIGMHSRAIPVLRGKLESVAHGPISEEC